ncbi:MAG: tRNA pseudouridine(13) synthase TruD [Thermoplasmata archaeon]
MPALPSLPCRWAPPERERAIGIGGYATGTAGIGGLLKQTPEDFVVQELSQYPWPADDGPFTILRVESRGWEQHELAEALARRLGLPRRSLRWAGTKDRRAVSERLFSYRGAPPSAPVDLPGAVVLEAYRARDGLSLGHHFGNRFSLRLRFRDEGEAGRAVEGSRAILRELRGVGGLPNYFGPQRFGEVRPITHHVGRAIVRGDLDAAVEIYLAETAAGSEGPGAEARRAYASHHDPVRARKEFPPEYRFERTLLEHLAAGHTAQRALRALSHELRLLFVHAYQSWLFNRWVTGRIRRGIPIDRPIPGDRILRLERDGTVRSDAAVPVDPENLPECADLVARGRAVVAGPLVGYATRPGAGAPGELLGEIMAEDGVRPEDFRLPRTPEIASAGADRPVRIPLPPIVLGRAAGDPTAVGFDFALPKGAYATIVLREFQKEGAIPA